MGKYTAKLTFLWYDNFGENQTLLHRNGMAAIPKTEFVLLYFYFVLITYILLSTLILNQGKGVF